MFRPKKMKRVRLIVLKSLIEKLVGELHELGVLDIRKTEYDGLEKGRPTASFEQISAELLKLRTTLTVMENTIGKVGNSGSAPGGRRTIQTPMKVDADAVLREARELSAIEERVKELSKNITFANEKIKALESEAAIVDKIMHFRNVDFSKLTTRTLEYRLGELPQAKLARLNNSLSKLDGGNGNQMLIAQPGFSTILLIFEKGNKNIIEGILSELGFNDFQLPAGMTTPNQKVDSINSELASKQNELVQLKKEISNIAKSNIDNIKRILRELEIEAERSEVAARFASSRKFYVLEGWILEEQFQRLQSLIANYGSAVELETVDYGHSQIPPTVLDNPKIASPMEFLTNSYSLPNYFEIDPTMLYLVALPIIYGMIVGDVLYGIVSLLLAKFLMKKFEKSYIMYNVSKIWYYSAIPTIIFGLFFDEWAGLSHFHLLEYIGKWIGTEIIHAPLYTGLHRLENVLALVGLSALVGVIHLGTGFALGAINEWNHNRKHAIAKIAWIGVEVGIVMALLPFIPSMIPELGYVSPELTTPGILIIIISAITLGVTEGVIGIIEIPGLVGNILSYSRIAAIGVVGVIIAELLNDFLIPLPSQGILILVMLPVFLVLHVLNCFVAMFESLVQGGRLNIVEFRSKFLHGGGDVFVPFSLYSKKL